MNVKNILVIKLRYVGDVLLATSILPLLSRHFPDSRISFLVNQGTEAVLMRNPYIHQVILVPRSSALMQLKFLGSLRKRNFDCVLDLTDGDRSAILSAWSGASIRVGFNHENRWRGKCYTHCFNRMYGTMHMVDYHFKALAPLGIEESVEHPHLFLSEEDEQTASRLIESLGLSGSRVIMLHPAARYWFKAWPPERFAALGDALVERGFQVVLVGSQQEKVLEETILGHSRRQINSLVGKTKILELAALMKRCTLFIGNDGGPMHMAAAVGCPVLALFGPTDPAVWGPRGTRTTVIYKGLNCSECFHPGCFRGEESCMRLITVEEVLDAAEELLSRSH